MSYYSGFFHQPSKAEIMRSAMKSTKKLEKKGKKLQPIIIEGRKIARSWWGNAWCENLESYADYANRIDRGRKYVLANAVIHLEIAEGEVKAIVQGSSLYNVTVKISPLDKDRGTDIIKQCSGEIENLEQLVKGEFPEGLKTLFTSMNGLFPSPKEIKFDCSCPDSAMMCKHVAAVLYGIGARLDNDPLLFFCLRGIDTDEFVSTAINGMVNTMLENEAVRSSRVMDDADVGKVFGIY